MPTMDECRRKAEECSCWADETVNDAQRETLLEIARLWTQMELSSAEPNGVDGAAQVSRFPEAPKREAGPQLGRPRRKSPSLTGLRSRLVAPLPARASQPAPHPRNITVVGRAELTAHLRLFKRNVHEVRRGEDRGFFLSVPKT